MYNIFRDHLGTITHLKNGSTITEYSFDAWGRRRDKDTWSHTLSGEPALFADRGFTGHEYLEDFKLYNMNGRLYDPVVGRFLSPDPYIQDPGFTQSMNRYSYCLNNPLLYTDPSGNTWWSQFRNWIGDGFNNLGDWMNQHPMQFGFSSGGPNGPVYFVSVPVKGNTNVSVGVNPNTGDVGVGNNSSGFTNFYFPGYNYDVAAQNAAASLDRTRDQYGEEWHAASQGDGNTLYTIGMGLNVAGFIASAGEYSNVVNGIWRGTNGNWNSLEWGGNQWTGARANAISRAGAFKLASRWTFVAGTVMSGYQGYNAYQKGDYNGVAKSGLDIGMGAFATFGGPPGWLIGGGYFGLDALGAFNRPFITIPYTPFYYAVPDNTYVAPPIIFPLR